MKDKEILTKAIEIAMKNGFIYTEHAPCDSEAIFYLGAYHCLIFNHDFAKAFWKQKSPMKCGLCGNRGGWYISVNLGCHFGTEEQWSVCTNCEGKSIKKDYIWEMRLREMVTAKEPLKYLETFL